MDNNRHIIVGTAGHVDHGKTELTAVLTGINTDRLPEEKKRGMTIVPGFVPLDLANGLRLGLIDMPGHEKFVKNMLAGVAGIDLVMLVVAADEGVMPQTVEHLHILHLLGIEQGVIVITKADLVDDEWLALVKEQIAETLAGTSLEHAPVVVTSAYSGQGIEELKQVLTNLAEKIEQKSSHGHVRLPIDRVFSKTGFGTVITGTLWSGELTEGQKVELWPAKLEARVRSLQVHGQAVEQAFAGQRTAVNLAGIESVAAPRGGWLAEPGLLRESFRVDVELRLLTQMKAISQRARVRVHHGTSEVLGRINLLDREELAAGESCFAQLELESPLPPLRGDRLIIRSYSPITTIAGATVLEAAPAKHKRYNEQVLQSLQALSQGSGADILRQLLVTKQAPFSLTALAQAAQLQQEQLLPLLQQLEQERQVLILDIDGEQQWLATEAAASLLSQLQQLLQQYHDSYPLRQGYPIQQLKSQLFSNFSLKQLYALLDLWQQQQQLQLSRTTVALAGFSPKLSEEQQAAVADIAQAYQEQLFTPPDYQQLAASLGIKADLAGELLLYLLETGQLIKAGDYYFSATAPKEALAILQANRKEEGFAAGDIRELLGANRKYTLALLEYMDAEKLTIRAGDKRFID